MQEQFDNPQVGGFLLWDGVVEKRELIVRRRAITDLVNKSRDWCSFRGKSQIFVKLESFEPTEMPAIMYTRLCVGRNFSGALRTETCGLLYMFPGEGADHPALDTEVVLGFKCFRNRFTPGPPVPPLPLPSHTHVHVINMLQLGEGHFPPQLSPHQSLPFPCCYHPPFTPCAGLYYPLG